VVAVYLLNFFHPGFCFKESLNTNTPTRIDNRGRDTASQGRTWYGRKKSSGAESSQEELRAEESRAEEHRRGWDDSVVSNLGQIV
jgi:hypothetical protein